MLLAIDVGNTQTHIGMFDGQELVEHWRLATDPEATADALATILSNLLALRDLRLPDIGTSTNYDVVSADGEYLGGVLAPGVEISIEALAQRAARLFKVDLDPPKRVIGKNTAAAIQSGVIYGFAGQVD